ncbi:primase C-terminal domain-containing protein [Anaerocaecibacter muris]|uniref:primase C-terminal domain-containing protein n=1 Tax=Anaerocaecibacter muris TaxID=2941513 RepID=UPI002041C7BE|nr:primase C-terminal domain-containing protein [Anaerocaecibacter muris]
MKAYEKKAASSIDSTTWSDFEIAKAAVENGTYDYVGFVFNDNGIVGIDVDDGFDSTGFLSDLSIDLMKACKSFTEKSRSGRGIHIYVKGKLPFNGKNNRQGVEIYQQGRFFITTGRMLVYKDLIENQAAIDYIVEKYFPEIDRVREDGTVEKAPAFYTPVFEKPANGKISLKPTYPKIAQGLRNQSLTSLAGQLHSRGYTKQQIYYELLRCNQEACTPPLPAREIQTIVNSVTKYQR